MRVILDREPEPELPGLFAPGMDWMRAAEAWAREQGLQRPRLLKLGRFESEVRGGKARNKLTAPESPGAG
jgi:hypothetical protein